MPSEPTRDHSSSRLHAGIALALRADESGDWKAVADWLAANPDMAGSLARFLGGQRDLKDAFEPPELVVALKPGARIGGYELLEQIGRGGMGIVYQAYDPVLKRDVALKLIRGETLSDASRARFHAEAETLANLDHPNVVRVYSSGESDSQPYLVMPLMEGGSLAHKLQQGERYSLRDAAILVRDAARGVHHAHQEGLIHRDLKPGNILLDSAGRPHVADFGLARSLESTATISGGIVGTPAYMAPEQARGDKRLTVAVDIHALGVILFELLTGRTPFGTEDVLQTLKRVQEEPAPSVRGSQKDVPAELEAICRVCLEKEPADRYRSAEELANDLTHFLNGEPVRVRELSVFTGLGRAVNHRPNQLLITSWPGFLTGAVVTFLTQGVCQAAVLRGADGWTVVAAFTANLAGWFILYWYFIVIRAQWKTSAMGQSGAYILAVLLAAAALIPAHLSGDRDRALELYQPLTAVFGAGAFVHGVTIWGRMYYAGSALIAIAAIMPLISKPYWPTVHALVFGGFAIWFGLWMRFFDRQARSLGANPLRGPDDK